MKYKTIILFIFLTAIPGLSTAGDRVIKFDLGLGLTFGGDELAYATFTDGSSEKIKAGELMHIYAGLLFDSPNSPINARLSYGYFFDEINAENGNIEFTRMPLELIPFYRINSNNRIGAGLTYHIDPKLSSSVFSEIKFDNALGFLVEYGYGFSQSRFWVSARYVSIDYKPASIGGIPIEGESQDGSHFGLYFQTAL